jgi:hypothetical protein
MSMNESRAWQLRSHWPAAVLCAALLSGSASARAADAADVLNDSFYLSLGSFIISTDTKVRLNGENLEGSLVDWEQTFGSGDVTRFRIDGQWRFADRHKLRFLWFSSSRSDSRRIEDEIDWGDETFPVDARVSSQFDFDTYELAYEYAFLRRPGYELSGSIGVHYTDLALALSAKASANEGQITEDIREEASTGAPLPAVGLRGTWTLPYHLWLDFSAQYFAISIDEYDGSLVDYKATLTWQPRKWFGLGFGYNKFAIDVDVSKDTFDGSLDWAYSGPMIFYSAFF